MRSVRGKALVVSRYIFSCITREPAEYFRSGAESWPQKHFPINSLYCRPRLCRPAVSAGFFRTHPDDRVPMVYGILN